MLLSSSLFAVAIAFLPSTFASSSTFVKPPSSNIWTKATGAGTSVRWKKVPSNICELNSKINSYSGYIDISSTQHVFFWFFEARKVNPSTAPLTVYLAGGPGYSSLGGLFSENGPCRISDNGTVLNNPYSLSATSNIIYIDQPVNTGFSYSNPVPGYVTPTTSMWTELSSNTCPSYALTYGTCGTYGYVDPAATANSTASALPNLYKTLQAFTGVFPKYYRSNIHLFTSGYAGQYGALFSQYLDTANKKLPKGSKSMSVASLTIGSGWLDPIVQYDSSYKYIVSPGNPYGINLLPSPDAQARLKQFLQGAGNCNTRNTQCNTSNRNDVCLEAYVYCVAEYYDAISTLDRTESDIRYSATSQVAPYAYVDYLNDDAVRAALGVYVSYSDYSYGVSRAFSTTGALARRAGSLTALQTMIKQGKTVFLYAPDADMATPWMGLETVASNLAASGYSNAGYASISVSSASSSSSTSTKKSSSSSTSTSATSSTTSVTSPANHVKVSSSPSSHTTFSSSIKSSSSSSATASPSSTINKRSPLNNHRGVRARQPEYNTFTPRDNAPASINAVTTQSGAAGVVKQSYNFAFARIYNAGHQVGASRPDVLATLFQRVVAGMDIQTGKTKVKKGYLSKGTKSSTYQEGVGGLIDPA